MKQLESAGICLILVGLVGRALAGPQIDMAEGRGDLLVVRISLVQILVMLDGGCKCARLAAQLQRLSVEHVTEHHRRLAVVLVRHQSAVGIPVAGGIVAKHAARLGFSLRQLAAEHVHPRQGLVSAERVDPGENCGGRFQVAGHDQDVRQLFLDLHVVGLSRDGLLEHRLAFVRPPDTLQDPAETCEVDRVVVDMDQTVLLDIEGKIALAVARRDVRIGRGVQESADHVRPHRSGHAAVLQQTGELVEPAGIVAESELHLGEPRNRSGSPP